MVVRDLAEGCKGCIKIGDVSYSDGYYTCSGIVRKPKPKNDVIRLCQVPPHKSGDDVEYTDMTLDEALDDSFLLSKAVSHYLKINTRKDRV